MAMNHSKNLHQVGRGVLTSGIEHVAARRGHRHRTQRSMVGGLVGAGIGSFFGPLGAALGAGIGALIGAEQGDELDAREREED